MWKLLRQKYVLHKSDHEQRVASNSKIGNYIHFRLIKDCTHRCSSTETPVYLLLSTSKKLGRVTPRVYFELALH